MSKPKELRGPDLARGYPLAELPDGGMLLGHAEGEPVLLARRGDDVFAVGAACTHYGALLSDGILVGDTVRCPWHHACFSLRTGEAVAAPAFKPVPCWDVALDGGNIRLAARRPAPQPRPAPAPAPASNRHPDSIIVIGAGAAGTAAADMLRREGYRGPITLIGAEANGPVDRPNLSKDYLAGGMPEDWLWLMPDTYFRDRDIELITAIAVTAIDPAKRRVGLADGRSFGYGALLLATGAEPVRLAIPGAELPHVHYLRNLEDSRAIIAAAEHAKRAVVVGASFIGLEAAASLRARGLAVHVAAPDARPLGRILGPEIGDFIRDLHEQHGVVFHLGSRPKAITADAVTLENGERIPADLVVAGIGVRPAVQLAQQAGIAVDNGVLVDAHLETGIPGIYAAGDIARYPDVNSGERARIEHWVVAQRQGQAAARNMLGRRERYTDVPFFWSAHYDITLNYVGHAERWDRIEIDGSIRDHDCTLRYIEDGKVRAVLTLFRDRENLRAEVEMGSEHNYSQY
jgi:NADPH-dependent 2,4-dienoyl-CoA reductase/sulfur reductase-like enzyme/nitrite reductase/ring-hydroxylating ferredoxin subunit